MRLKAIAAERADTIATIIHKSLLNEGDFFSARKADIKANGNAKTECSNFIICKTCFTFPIF
jgi:hypothetical protein